MPCICAFWACLGFCFIYNIRGRLMVTASMGGVLGWYVYLLCSGMSNDIPRYFVATVVISLYAEMMARVNKVPVIVYLIVALLPLVPGAGMYATMEYCINGDTAMFAETGVHTFMIAGALALGIVFVSSLVRLWKTVQRSHLKAS